MNAVFKGKPAPIAEAQKACQKELALDSFK
jgi:hypothetical protein